MAVHPPLDVPNRLAEQVNVVPEHANRTVTAVAENASDLTGFVIVINWHSHAFSRPGCTTDSAAAILLCKKFVILFCGDAVAALQVVRPPHHGCTFRIAPVPLQSPLRVTRLAPATDYRTAGLG